jgi:hypothetical protein
MLSRQPDLGSSGSEAEADSVVQRLREDIMQAAQLDTLYSPQSDVIRHVLGKMLCMLCVHQFPWIGLVSQQSYLAQAWSMRPSFTRS